MTGPEHYTKAEGLLRTAGQMAARTGDADRAPEEVCDLKDSIAASLGAAQVHATLALAAATAALCHPAAADMVQWRQAGAL